MTHTMTTDAEGQPTFTCSAGADAECRIWADCLSSDGCESRDPDCTHEKVAHDHCILSEWFRNPEDTIAMYVDEDGNDGETPRPNVVDAAIEIEWDECPLWSFA